MDAKFTRPVVFLQGVTLRKFWEKNYFSWKTYRTLGIWRYLILFAHVCLENKVKNNLRFWIKIELFSDWPFSDWRSCWVTDRSIQWLPGAFRWCQSYTPAGRSLLWCSMNERYLSHSNWRIFRHSILLMYEQVITYEVNTVQSRAPERLALPVRILFLL
jgi:hypothetical protein